MRRWFWFVTSHPKPVLALGGLLLLGFGAFLPSLTRDTSPDAFIPPDHPALARKGRVEAEFGIRDPLVVAVFRDAPGGIFNAETLRLIDDLSRSIQDMPQVDPGDVVSLATESGVVFEGDEPGFERLMPAIPQTPAAIEALRRDVLSYELYRGTLVAEDGSAAAIIVRSQGGASDDALFRRLSALVGKVPLRDERLMVAGEAAVRAHMGVAVSDDALRMNFICPLFMVLLIMLAYRTGRGTVLPLFVIGGASALALGGMAAAGVPIYIVTNGIFVIIMALGVADSLHLLGQYYEEQLDPRGRGRQEIVVDSCMALWYPLLMTSLTDVAGFLALHLAGIMPPIRSFGLFTCVGVLGALLYSYTVVPAGLTVLPLRMSRAFRGRSGAAGGPRALDAVGSFMGRLGSLTWHRKGSVLAVCAVILAAAGWGASKLVVNDARILAFKADHPLVRATEAINERFDGTGQLNVMVTAREKGALVRAEQLRRIEALEAFTERLPYVGGTHSIAGWVKRAHQKSHGEDPRFYAIPEDESDTEFYLDVLIGPGSPMARMLREVVDESYTRANLIVRMTSSQFVHQREVISRVGEYLGREFGDGALTAEIGGRADLDYHWIRLVRASHIRSVCFSIACVLLLTGLMFRSLVAGLLCTMTVGAAVLFNYAVMGAGGISLGVGTSMFASIAIGAGVNFPIHVLDRLRVGLRTKPSDPAGVFRESLAFTGRALFFTALVVTAGFLLLLMSEFRTLIRFGLLIGIGMAISFLASVTMLPAAVAALRPGFLWPGETHRAGRGTP